MIYGCILVLYGMASVYVIASRNSRFARKLFLFVTFTALATVLGLRGRTVGEDTAEYLLVFESAKAIPWNQLFAKGLRVGYYIDIHGYVRTIESVWVLLCKIIQLFSTNGQVYLFVVATVTCWLFAKFIYENSERVLIPVYVFICEFAFMNAFNGMRQMLAVAVAAQMYSSIKRNSILRAVLLYIVAILIHNSAAVCGLLFVIMLMKPKKEYRWFKYLMVAAIMMPVLMNLLKGIIGYVFPRYLGYFEQNYWETSAGGIVVLWLFEFALILLLYVKRFSIKDSYNLSAFVLMYLGLEFAGFQVSVLGRLAWYFRTYLILFFPVATRCLSPKLRRMVYIGLFMILSIMYFSAARVDARQYSFFFQ